VRRSRVRGRIEDLYDGCEATVPERKCVLVMVEGWSMKCEVGDEFVVGVRESR
jgi:hypothetical protein